MILSFILNFGATIPDELGPSYTTYYLNKIRGEHNPKRKAIYSKNIYTVITIVGSEVKTKEGNLAENIK